MEAWLSWLEHTVHIREVTGSSPVASTTRNLKRIFRLFFCFPPRLCLHKAQRETKDKIMRSICVWHEIHSEKQDGRLPCKRLVLLLFFFCCWCLQQARRCVPHRTHCVSCALRSHCTLRSQMQAFPLR